LPNAVTDLVPQLRFIAPELSVNDEDVSEQIKPFFVRTTKSDLDLPEPKRILIPISMREEQRKLYELLCSEIARDAERDMGRDARRAFRAIGRSAVRLLQYVSNPSLLAGKIPEFDDYLGQVIEEGDSPKMEWVCGRAHQLARQRKKVIIWSSFVGNVEVLAERLEDLGANFIHGGVEASSDAEADSREARVLRFHEDPYAMVLVANPAACGEGISLHTVCDHAIYLDRNYNAAQYLQSEDRIHRIGSDHQKFVEIVVCPDSVDLSVDRRLRAKITRMAETLNDRDLRVSPISIDPDEINLDDDDVLDLLAHLRTAEEAAA
jgi:SNF2 family DNA or RNA helicase